MPFSDMYTNNYENQNHNEMPLHTAQGGCYEKIRKKK